MSRKSPKTDWEYDNVKKDYEAEVLLPESNRNIEQYNDKTDLGSYQEVFDAAGFGKWNFLLLAQCGWANASDAIEIMCISFTIDSLHDSLNLAPAQATWLTLVLFLGLIHTSNSGLLHPNDGITPVYFLCVYSKASTIGMMFGGYVWGSLADIWGRRKVVIYSLAINGLFGAVSGLSRSYWLLLLLRFISGFGAGGSLPVCFSYFSEFQPREKRGAMISALATSWMAGNILAAGIAWLTLPSSSLATVSPYGDQWRFFIILCAIPSLTSSAFFYFMPESPKFLMEKGNTKEAFTVLKRIFYINNPHKTLQFSGIQENEEDLFGGSEQNLSNTGFVKHAKNTRYRGLNVSPRKCFYCCGRVLISIGSSIKHQFMTVCGSGSKARRESILMMCVYFSIAFGGYGLSMWLPYLMQRAEDYSGSPCSAPPNTTITHNANSTEMYTDVFIGAAAQLPANILTILVIDRIGGRIVVVVSLFLSGISVLFLYLVKTKIEVILVSAAFNCVSTMVWNGLDVVTPEMYETSVRAAATGLLTALSRIASILGTTIFGVFMDSNCNIPILTVCVVLLLGGVASVFLPNTRRIELR